MYFPKKKAKRREKVLNIRSNSFVSFFHASISDFVIQDAENEDSIVESSEKAHLNMALICIRMIVEKSSITLVNSWERGYLSNSQKISKSVFLSWYAMQFWHAHLKEAIPADTPVAKIDSRILLAVRDLVELWRSDTTIEYRKQMLRFLCAEKHLGSMVQNLTPLEILSALGLDPFLRIFIGMLSKITPPGHMRSHAENALILACRSGHEATFSTILVSFDIRSLEGSKFDTLLLDSTWGGNPRLLERIVRLRKTKLRELVSALVAAFMKGDPENLDILANDMSLKNTDHFGMTPIHGLFAFATNGLEAAYIKTMSVCKAIVSYLIEHGVKIEAQDNCGFTALHWACCNQYFCDRSIIEFLVSVGANPSTPQVLVALHRSTWQFISQRTSMRSDAWLN